jgi:energy-coupling factor transporter transmembrane protein EcfT
MAEVITFHYQKGNSHLHSVDTRLKLLLLIVYSASMFKLETTAIVILSPVIILTFIYAVTSPWKILKEMRGIYFLLILIFTGTIFSTPGNPLIKSIPTITKEGLFKAILTSWKFLTLIIMGMIFSATTLPEKIHIAVYKILKPIPFINASSVASKVSLTMMFIPLLMDMLGEVIEARKSRYVEGSKNPVKNIISLVVPVTSGVIYRAEETALALESRLYDGESTGEQQRFKKNDYKVLLIGITPIVIALFFQIININI